jgi:hypothetical protein
MVLNIAIENKAAFFVFSHKGQQVYISEWSN